MKDCKIRRKFHKSIKPLTKTLVRYGIKPNTITTSSLILLLPACYFLIDGEERLFIILFSIISFFDALDGAIAENEKLKTRFGGFYDAFSDRIVEGAVLFSLTIYNPSLSNLAFISLILSYLTSYIASWQKDLKNIGVGKRSIRLVVFIVSFIFGAIYYGLILISILAVITIFQRLWYMFKYYSSMHHPSQTFNNEFG